MTDTHQTFTSWTLGDIQTMNMVLEGICVTDGCNAFERFDLDSLIARFGADWLVPKVLPLTCSKCEGPLHFQVTATLQEEEPNA